MYATKKNSLCRAGSNLRIPLALSLQVCQRKIPLFRRQGHGNRKLGAHGSLPSLRPTLQHPTPKRPMQRGTVLRNCALHRQARLVGLQPRPPVLPQLGRPPLHLDLHPLFPLLQTEQQRRISHKFPFKDGRPPKFGMQSSKIKFLLNLCPIPRAHHRCSTPGSSLLSCLHPTNCELERSRNIWPSSLGFRSPTRYGDAFRQPIVSE